MMIFSVEWHEHPQGMESNKGLPFRNLDNDAWRRLGYMAVAVIYVLVMYISVETLGLFNGVGGVFIQFLTAGRVSDLYDFSKIYDVNLVKQVQIDQLSNLKIPFSAFE